jgi:hypothetical protein
MTYDSFAEYFVYCIHRIVGSVCNCNMLHALKIFVHLSADQRRAEESISHNVRNLFRAKTMGPIIVRAIISHQTRTSDSRNGISRAA